MLSKGGFSKAELPEPLSCPSRKMPVYPKDLLRFYAFLLSDRCHATKVIVSQYKEERCIPSFTKGHCPLSIPYQGLVRLSFRISLDLIVILLQFAPPVVLASSTEQTGPRSLGDY